MTRARHGRPHGGDGGAEPRLRIREREQRVLHLVIRGRTQQQIATEVGVSQPAVSKILKRVEDRLVADVAPMVERWRVRQTLRLDHVYSEAIAGWEASKQDSVRRRQRKLEAGRGPGGTLAELVSENRPGDPSFLEVARRALADLRAIWGVNAPDRLAVSATAAFASLSDAALEAELRRQDQVYHQLTLTRANAPRVDAPTSDGHADERV
jgi:uncharacterized protein YerC